MDAGEPRPDHEPLVHPREGGREPLRLAGGPRRRQQARAPARGVLEGARRPDVAAQAAPRRRLPQRRALQRGGGALHLRARARPQPEVAQPGERGRGGAGRGGRRLHGQPGAAPALRAAPQPAHRLPDRPAEVHRREGQPGPRPAPGRHRPVPLRGAGEGRPPDRGGLRPALARRSEGPAHRLQADPGAVHPRGRPAQQRGRPDRHGAAEPGRASWSGRAASGSSACPARGSSISGSTPSRSRSPTCGCARPSTTRPTRTRSSRACSTATRGGWTARSPRTCSASIRR